MPEGPIVKTEAPKRSGMFNYVPGKHQPKPVRNGIIFFVLVGALLFMGYTKNIPFFNEGGQKLKAHVASSANIFPGNEVRVNGVRVGRVKKVERDPSGVGADVSMDIKDDKVTVKKDARASVYWRTLLGGNFYVELQPGSRSADKMEDGGTIGLSHTSTQVEFDQLLTSFDESGRTAVKTFLKQFQKGFEGRDAGSAIERLGPAMRSAAPAVKSIRGVQPGKDIPQLARGGAKTLRALARNENELAGLINGANTTLAVTAARRESIGATLDQAPPAFDETRTTLDRLRTTLDTLDPVADDLRPGVRRIDETVAKARPAMRELRDFIPDALPVLRDVDPALRKLRGASKRGAPLMQALTPTLDRLINQINPFLEERDPETDLKNAWAIGPFFSGIGSSSGAFDANGFSQNFDTAPAPGDFLSSSFDCTKLDGAAEAGCKVLLGTLGKALGAGPSAQTGAQP